MARTSGHGNAPWSKDETILALDLLVQLDGHVPGKEHPEVVALSKYLRGLPTHPPDKRKGSFRNPDGVAFKLQNLRAVATGKGLKNVSQMDQEVWATLGHKPSEVQQLAADIRANAQLLEALVSGDEQDEGEEFAEGAVATKLHKQRERNRSLRNKLIAKSIASGRLHCCACGDHGPALGEDYGPAMFEAHHIKPLSGGPAKTKLSDLVLLCANCHRLIHRVMAVQKQWTSIESFKALVHRAQTQIREAA